MREEEKDAFTASVEAVNREHKKTLEDNAAACRPPAVSLGRQGKSYVFYSPSCGDIFEYPPEKLDDAGILRTLAPLEHWERWLFPAEVAAGVKVSRKELLDAAQARLLADSRGKHFDADKVRARGVWPDSPDGWLYNAGSSCWHVPGDGKNVEKVDHVRGVTMYAAGVALPEPSEAILTDAEGLHLLEMITERTWSMPGAGELVSGWLISSLLAGVLPMRPHIWVNAPPGTGKTYLKRDMKAILGDYAIEMEGVPTEAAIRHNRKSDCLPLLLDEVEQEESELNKKRLTALIELMRSASYSGKVARGTKDGAGVMYHVKYSFALFSIANTICREADSSRFLLLPLRRVTDKKITGPMWKRQEPGRALLRADGFHGRLMARLLAVLPVLMKNVKELRDYLAMLDNVDSRRAELFAVLMSCRHALTSREKMCADDMQHAAVLLRAYEEQEDKESDFSRCLDILTRHQVEVSGAGKMTITDACGIAVNGASADIRGAAARALELYGMRWREDKNALQVYTGAERIKLIYKGTPWASGKITPVLMDGGQGCYQAQAKIGGVNSRRCLFIPAALILGD